MTAPRAIALLATALAAAPAAAGIHEIDFWIGQGAKHSALVIDWDEDAGAGPALVWGVRWDQPPTGEALLRSVFEADPRAFAKLTESGMLGTAVFGVGYDFTGDGAFELTDATAFGADGVAIGVASPTDTNPFAVAAAVDPADRYAEGLLTAGFWHYTVASAPAPGAAPEWASSGLGATTRVLADGEWDGWTFTRYLRPDGSPKAFAELFETAPDAAVGAPAPRAPGDFNGDGRVDAGDYTVWRDAEGVAVAVPGAGADGDASGLVDAADAALWRDRFVGEAPAAAVPEPTALPPLIFCLLMFAFLRSDNSKRRVL